VTDRPNDHYDLRPMHRVTTDHFVN